MRLTAGRLLSVAIVALTLAAVLVVPMAGTAAAAECPNEQLRKESDLNGLTGQRYSAELPDCRAFEMVTPVEKEQGAPGEYGYNGGEPFWQASVNGESVLFSSTDPLPQSSAGPLYSQYVGERGSEGWTTVGLDAAQLLAEKESSMVDEFLAFSPSLSCGVDETQEALTELPAGEQVGEVQNLYVWQAGTGASSLVSNTNPSNRISLEGIHSVMYFVYGVSADCSRVVFSTNYQLLPGAPSPALYEWSEGTLSLASQLPDGTAISPLRGGESHVGDFDEADDRVAFTAVSDTTTGSPGEIDSGHDEVYVREGGTGTVEASRSETATPDAGALYQVGFGEGTPEGFQVLFTANYGLTPTSSKGLTACTLGIGSEIESGCDLYDYDVDAKTLTDISADANASDAGGADVVGVLGAGASSSGGSYVYFAALGQLIPGKGNTEAVNVSAKEANIYVTHDGQLEYIAKIPRPSGLSQDLVTYEFFYSQSVARVTPSGKYLLFGDEGNEIAALTDGGYDNDTASGAARDEYYLYSAEANRTVCVSCDPSGEQPRAFSEGALTSDYGINNGYALRNLSEDGERVFFDSPDEMTPLAAAVDANLNAYEWEREGADASCPVQEHPSNSGGCLFLLAANGSIRDASASGNDVFIATRVPLVSQDRDGLIDVYDARVNGGFPAVKTSECAGEECQGAASEPLALLSAGSTGPPVVGNAVAEPESKQAKTKSLTRAQRLARALKRCASKPKRKRRSCEAQARLRYGAKTKRTHKVKARPGKKAVGERTPSKGGK